MHMQFFLTFKNLNLSISIYFFKFLVKMDSNILFSRGNTSTDENDVWDDTALIKAYDKAVNRIKDDLTKTEKKSSHKSEKKSSRKKNERKEEAPTTAAAENWNVGDHCIAVYSEDNVAYPAVIIEIDHEKQTCKIRYDYYENEEDKRFDELYEVAESDVEKTAEKKKSTKSASSKKQQKEEQYKLPQLDFPIPPPPPPLPASLISHFNNLSMHEGEDSNAAAVDDKEAFYSMLMSWYMSGYHTGYYFGLTQRQFKTTNFN